MKAPLEKLRGPLLENPKENFGEDQSESRIPICKQKNGTHSSSNFEGKCGRGEFVFLKCHNGVRNGKSEKEGHGRG